MCQLSDESFVNKYLVGLLYYSVLFFCSISEAQIMRSGFS